MSKPLTKMILIPYDRYKSLLGQRDDPLQGECQREKFLPAKVHKTASTLKSVKHSSNALSLTGGSTVSPNKEEEEEESILPPPPGQPVNIESISPIETHPLLESDWSSQWIPFEKNGGRRKHKGKIKRRD